jgi:hypothetical protein
VVRGRDCGNAGIRPWSGTPSCATREDEGGQKPRALVCPDGMVHRLTMHGPQVVEIC